MLTWSWACTTGHPASDQILEAAANAAWPYALLCAWTFLNDKHMAHDLMDHAIQNTTQYVARHPNVGSAKVKARVKSEIRRHAKHLASKQEREHGNSSALDVDAICAFQPALEQRVYASELLSKLSPFAQGIVNRRWLGYSWREIGRELKLDHSEIRKAYFRELNLLLGNLSQLGESPKCD